MAFERGASYGKFLALNEQQRIAQFVAILQRNAEKKAEEWFIEDVDIILGLSSQESVVKHAFRPSDRPNYPSKYTLLDDYLDNEIVKSALSIENKETQTLHAELKMDPNPFLAKLRNRFPAIINFDVSETGGVNLVYKNRGVTVNLPLIGRSAANLFWHKRNHGQRTAMYGIAPLALTAGILGAVSGESAALTTAGLTMSKLLPGFITAFGVSHAIPPAALAFYVIAGVLAVAAIALFLASTAYAQANQNAAQNASDPGIEILLGKSVIGR